ncbi:MAG: histidine triad nucleotide-binding protein [Clostridia bacterium]|nr:histidine triad nucleotide-binding protein [Clostridia bacterium]MBQ4619622.1 histidine triad nucleotide-binding protein [Clostridia bacterium]MBQ9856928.1 histidine triad nucleotide-binding protein [Clostridia bacterium]
MGDCIFCKIIAGDIPSNKVYEDELVYAFRDINPQAPVHILVAPKEHMKDMAECATRADDLAGHIMKVCVKIAENEGLVNGFRLVTNKGEDGRQSVGHLHVHILGGGQLSEKMG